jgi:hypothetical protein
LQLHSRQRFFAQIGEIWTIGIYRQEVLRSRRRS